MYCLSRNECDDLAQVIIFVVSLLVRVINHNFLSHNCIQALVKNRIKATAYHAGLSDTDRSDAQMKWINGTVQVGCTLFVIFSKIVSKNEKYL